MLNIPQQLVSQRYNHLPEKSRQALLSQTNGEFVYHLAQENHLDEIKTFQLSVLAGDVLFGFLHREDFARNIEKDLNINRALAETLAQAIDRRIFEPLAEEIESSYAPPAAETRGAEIIPETEPPIQETIKKPEIPPIPIIREILPKTPLAQEQQIKSEEKTIAGPLTEEPGPVFIHQESRLEPVKEEAGLSIKRFQPEKKPIPPLITARIEFEQQPKEKPRIVHYGQYRTPLAEQTTDNKQPTAPDKPPSSVSAPIPKKIPAPSWVKPTPPKPFEKIVDLSDSNKKLPPADIHETRN